MRITVDDGVGLEVLATGPLDAPGLLLVHGFGGAKEDFADHVDALAADHRVVVFDHRGHGASDAPKDPAAYSLDRLAADTLAVAEATGLHDLRLLGHSMGGMVARRIVLGAAQRVVALVLMDTSPGAPPGLDPDLVALGIDLARTGAMDELKVMFDSLAPLGSAAGERVLAERPGFREYDERKWASLSSVMWATLLGEIVHQPDQLPALAAVQQPTLIMVGEEDETFLPASLAMAATMPDAQLVVIPDAGHSPQFENPAAWLDALTTFLHQLASPKAV
jgi:pimeloyl-ACP methyl ester carboxylesterase